MRVSTVSSLFGFAAAVLWAAAVSAPAPAADTPAVEPTQEGPAEAVSPTQPEPPGAEDAKLIELGSPLVDDPKALIRLDVTRPVWLDKANKRVVILGRVCQQDAPLELFACLARTKEHEAIVSVDVEAYTVHAGLLAAGAEPGMPARWTPEYIPAHGTEIEVTVVWKDTDGQTRTARAQEWILDTRTDEPMTDPWVFAGSSVWVDEETGREYYQAESGDFICVSNFPSAMLDLPIKSSESASELLFRALTERIPPLGTPVTLLLTPKLERADETPPKPDEPEKPADAESPQQPAPPDDT